MMKKNILIIGTGTIGEPLIGLLADMRHKLGLQSVYFHKRTPLVDEIAKVESLTRRGAKLVTFAATKSEFESLGHKVACVYQKALQKADVVIDCTPAGNENKELYYLPKTGGKKKRLFIAQGSEKGFGMPYAYGINDKALDPEVDFIQVVSCNTHNISSLIKTLTPDVTNLVYGDFTCIRRANDISQEGNFIASPQPSAHTDARFGTHHARDTFDLFNTMYQIPNIFSSALKINSQYMHVIRFSLQIKGTFSKEAIINLLEKNKFIALTHKASANKVFSFGRDHGFYGRIYNHTVVSLPSLYVGQLSGETLVTGYCFTPQDGNSLLSSCAAAMRGLYGRDYLKQMSVFDQHLFDIV
tara:strand:+ start:3237 stop:4304 length:1068 start_codon:yes stop_codon:yes gene_type:complete